LIRPEGSDDWICSSRGFLAVSHVGHKGDVTGALDSDRQTTLVACAVTTDAARQDFASFRDVLFQAARIFVIDVLELIRAEIASLSSSGRTVTMHTYHLSVSPSLKKIGYRKKKHTSV